MVIAVMPSSCYSESTIFGLCRKQIVDHMSIDLKACFSDHMKSAITTSYNRSTIFGLRTEFRGRGCRAPLVGSIKILPYISYIVQINKKLISKNIS